MIRLTGRLLVGTALVMSGLVVAGCEKKPVRPKVDTSAMAGTWVEKKTDAGRGRVQVVGPQSLRHLTINSDKTFEFTLTTDSGQAIDGKATGTWAVEGEMVVFDVKENTFKKEEHKQMAPASSDGVFEREFTDRGKVMQLEVIDQDDAPAYFEKG